MKASGLRLKSYFYPEALLESFPHGEDMPQLPLGGAMAYVPNSKMLHVSLNLQWGEKDKHLYALEIHVHGVFDFPESSPGQGVSEFLSRNLKEFAINATQILLGACREKILQMTACAPFGARYLPGIIVEDSDVRIMLSEEMDTFLLSAKHKAKPKLGGRGSAQGTKRA